MTVVLDGFEYNMEEYTLPVLDININTQPSLFLTYSLKTCLSECNKENKCLSVAFVTNLGHCLLYNKVFSFNETVQHNNCNFYTKKIISNNLKNTIEKFNLQSSISTYYGIPYSWAHSFLIVKQDYYVTDYGNNRIVIYDKNWTLKNVTILDKGLNPLYILFIDNEFYLSANAEIIKMDQNFNILKRNSIGVSSCRGIVYNDKTNLIYLANIENTIINVYDKNLNLVNCIDIKPHIPTNFLILPNKLQMFVGTSNGSIIIIENDKITNLLTTKCTAAISSFLNDNYGNLGILCSDSKLYLYDTNGVYTDKFINTSLRPVYMNYDLNERFIITSKFNIDFYY